jgi:hypothetical protein
MVRQRLTQLGNTAPSEDHPFRYLFRLLHWALGSLSATLFAFSTPVGQP